jgi:hypothetical protein
MHGVMHLFKQVGFLLLHAQVCCTFQTAVAAAALLADLTASSALSAAANGQPAQVWKCFV